jgi:hypothetical protein
MSLYDAITKRLDEEKKAKTISSTAQKTIQPSKPIAPAPSKPITSILSDTINQLYNMKPVEPTPRNVGTFRGTTPLTPVVKTGGIMALQGLSKGLQAADKVVSPIVQPLRDWSQTPTGQAVKGAVTSGGIGSLLNSLPKTMVSPTKVTEPLQVLADRGVNSATLGALDYLMPQTQAEKFRQENHPVASTIGTMGGYLIPGVGIEKGIMKALPKLAVKEGESIIKQSAKRAGIDALSGGITGGVEGGLSAAANKQNILEGIGKGGLVGGAMGGALGGIIGGVGGKLEVNKIFSKGLTDVGQSIDNYKFPQLREPQILPLPDKSFKNPYEIPLKYQQLPKTNEPLMLNAPKGTYLRPLEQKTFTAKSINTPVTESNIALKNKPMSLKGEVSPTEYSNMSREDLIKLKKEMLNEKGKIFSEQVEWLNSKGSRGNKSTKGNLYWDEGGNVTGGGKGFSNNELWYQELSKNNRVWNDETKKWIYKKPTQAEIKEIAEKQLSAGVDSNFGQIPKNDYYSELSSRINKIDETLNTPSNKYPINVNIKQVIPYDVTTLQKKPSFSIGKTIDDLKLSKDKKNPFYVDPKFKREVVGSPTGIVKNENSESITPKIDIDAKIDAQKQALSASKNEPSINSPINTNEPIKTQTLSNANVTEANVGKNMAEPMPTQENISKFGTNTYKRTTEISQEVKDVTPEKVFGYTPKTTPEIKAKAVANVENDFQRTVDKLLKKDSFTDIEQHEAAIIAKHLESKAMESPEAMNKYLNFMDNGATKGASEAGGSLKAVDTAWQKEPTASKAIMEAQQTAKKAENFMKEKNPKKYAQYELEVQKYQKAIKQSIERSSKSTTGEVIRDLKGKFGNLCD